MPKFFTIIILFFSLFPFTVFVISSCNKCTVEEAVKRCKDYCKKVFIALFQTEHQPQTVYPTVVGWDGFRIVPQFVNMEFKKVCANFDVCYLSGYKLEDDNNTVKYKFAVQRQQNSPSDEDLQTLIQKQAEEVLTELLLTYGCNLPAEALTAVELQPHFLYVAFARTPQGIQQLDALKQRILKRQASRKRQRHTGKLSEEWKDGRNG